MSSLINKGSCSQPTFTSQPDVFHQHYKEALEYVKTTCPPISMLEMTKELEQKLQHTCKQPRAGNGRPVSNSGRLMVPFFVGLVVMTVPTDWLLYIFVQGVMAQLLTTWKNMFIYIYIYYCLMILHPALIEPSDKHKGIWSTACKDNTITSKDGILETILYCGGFGLTEHSISTRVICRIFAVRFLYPLGGDKFHDILIVNVVWFLSRWNLARDIVKRMPLYMFDDQYQYIYIYIHK